MNQNPETIDRADAEEERRLARSRAGEWLWYGTLSVFLLLVTVIGFSMAAAVSPRFCAVCHRSAVDDLAQSAHADTTCDSCHAGSDVLSLAENRLWVAGMVIASPVRAVFPSGAQAQVDQNQCIGCHEAQLAATAESNGIIMNHRAPVNEDWSCQRCHRQIAHGPEGQTAAVYTMGTCLGCHSTSTQNITSCGTCHPENARPSANRLTQTSFAVTHGSNWQSTHGMGDLETCDVCHAKDYCIGCHGMSLPHKPNYLKAHGEEMAQVGREACLTCHQAASCDACHGGVEMPHPNDFTSGHSQLVESEGQDSCETCHAESSCTECHERHRHPGLTPERRRELEDRPVSVR